VKLETHYIDHQKSRTLQASELDTVPSTSDFSQTNSLIIQEIFLKASSWSSNDESDQILGLPSYLILFPFTDLSR